MSKISDMLSSSLSNLMNIPKAENKLLKSSLYNCLAILLLLTICASTISVYFLFEIFIKPLMWAVLVGTCIFPFKRSVTTFLRKWVNDLDKRGQPLFVAISLSPFNIFNSFAELLTSVIIRRFKLFLFYIFGIPMIYSVYNFGVFSKFLQITATVYFTASDVLALFGSKVVSIVILTMAIVLCVCVIFITNGNVQMLKILSTSIWILVVVQLSNLAGNFALFVFTSTMIFLLVGGITDFLNIDITKLSSSQLLLLWEYICRPYKYSPKDEDSTTISELEDECISEDDLVVGFGPSSSHGPVEGRVDENVSSCADYMGDVKETETSKVKSSKIDSIMKRTSSVIHNISGLLSTTSRTLNSRLFDKDRYLTSSQGRRSSIRSPKKVSNKTLVNRTFTFLLWSHIIVYSWSNLSVMLIILVALLLMAFKKIVTKLEIGDLIGCILSLIKLKMFELMGNHQQIVVPGFIRGSFRIFLQFDNKLRRLLNSGLDSLVSMTLIAVLVSATIFLTIFLAFQVHKESIQLVALTSNVLNRTMPPGLYDWLPEEKDVISMLETVTNNIYLFGREWISKKIDQLFDTNAYNKARIEEQALELWEKLYQRVLSKNSTNITVGMNPTLMDKITTNKHYSVTSFHHQILDFWDLLTSFDVLDLKKISDLIHENLGFLSTVIESLWLFVRSNINLVLSLSTGIFSVILGGGTVVLNFLLSLIIFLSALFYLLTYSTDRYLPLHCISLLTPNADNNPILQTIYLSVENGISAVFAVTMKMACLYGFYTSLTHYIFGVNLVVIPSIMAAILAAVPIVGTYWVTIPAITELVFINHDYVAASILLVLHILPMYVIDTAIYSEIKETGHPYLTGLAIAGGVCWLGIQGVVLGPILLCSLVIVLNMFTTLMSQYSNEGTLSRIRTKQTVPPKKLLKKSKSYDKSSEKLGYCDFSVDE